jgi:hypothetical protein
MTPEELKAAKVTNKSYLRTSEARPGGMPVEAAAASEPEPADAPASTGPAAAGPQPAPEARRLKRLLRTSGRPSLHGWQLHWWRPTSRRGAATAHAVVVIARWEAARGPTGAGVTAIATIPRWGVEAERLRQRPRGLRPRPLLLRQKQRISLLHRLRELELRR